MCYITRALRITVKCHACAKCGTENISQTLHNNFPCENQRHHLRTHRRLTRRGAWLPICAAKNLHAKRYSHAAGKPATALLSAANHPRMPKNRKKTARRFASIKITRKFALAKRNWCHSSVGRAKD